MLNQHVYVRPQTWWQRCVIVIAGCHSSVVFSTGHKTKISSAEEHIMVNGWVEFENNISDNVLECFNIQFVVSFITPVIIPSWPKLGHVKGSVRLSFFLMLLECLTYLNCHWQFQEHCYLSVREELPSQHSHQNRNWRAILWNHSCLLCLSWS